MSTILQTVAANKILLIDDDEDDAHILSSAFWQCGITEMHYVFTAMEGFMYLQSLEHDALPKLIITDHFLPGISGVEFLKDLKGMDKYKHIPVIVLSSTKTDKEIERYKQMGALDYLVKPVTYNDYVRVAAEMKTRVKL